MRVEGRAAEYIALVAPPELNEPPLLGCAHDRCRKTRRRASAAGDIGKVDLRLALTAWRACRLPAKHTGIFGICRNRPCANFVQHLYMFSDPGGHVKPGCWNHLIRWVIPSERRSYTSRRDRQTLQELKGEFLMQRAQILSSRRCSACVGIGAWAGIIGLGAPSRLDACERRLRSHAGTVTGNQ